MIWHILAYWASFFIPTFYRRVQGHNLELLQQEGPVIIAMNHPNAFMDPVAITFVVYPLRTHYLARGDAFKPGLVSWLLEKIGIVPIFRLQDAGKEGLKKNDETFRKVNQLLRSNAKVIVFAEGLCIQERRLRPMKKGVARMVFSAYQAINDDRLQIIPVGVNYSKPDKFRSTLLYQAGPPLKVKDYQNHYTVNPARAQNILLQDLERSLKPLITHVDHRENDCFIHELEELTKPARLKEEGFDPKNLRDDFVVLQKITNELNILTERFPEEVKNLRDLSATYFSKLRRSGIGDRLLDPVGGIRPRAVTAFLRLLLALTVLPFFLPGLLFNFAPLLLSSIITKKLVPNREFFASFALGAGMIVFPIWYILAFLLISLTAGTGWSLVLCTVFALSGAIALHFIPFIHETFGILKVLTNLGSYRALCARRKEILDLLTKIQEKNQPSGTPFEYKGYDQNNKTPGT